MKDENEINCTEDEEQDYLNHLLNEQITRICVREEEERIREDNIKN